MSLKQPIDAWTKIWTLDLHGTSLMRYQLTYPDWIWNISLKFKKEFIQNSWWYLPSVIEDNTFMLTLESRCLPGSVGKCSLWYELGLIAKYEMNEMMLFVNIPSIILKPDKYNNTTPMRAGTHSVQKPVPPDHVKMI